MRSSLSHESGSRIDAYGISQNRRNTTHIVWHTKPYPYALLMPLYSFMFTSVAACVCVAVCTTLGMFVYIVSCIDSNLTYTTIQLVRVKYRTWKSSATTTQRIRLLGQSSRRVLHWWIEICTKPSFALVITQTRCEHNTFIVVYTNGTVIASTWVYIFPKKFLCLGRKLQYLEFWRRKLFAYKCVQ